MNAREKAGEEKIRAIEEILKQTEEDADKVSGNIVAIEEILKQTKEDSDKVSGNIVQYPA